MSQDDCYAGIDPGSKGSVTLIWPHRGLMLVTNLPTTKETGSSRTFTYCDGESLALLLEQHHPVRSFLERVHSMPHDGPVGAFTFGDNFGTIKGVHAGLHIPVSKYLPRTWKAAMGLTADKQAAKAKAKLLFPSCAQFFTRPDHAESAMLCLYGMLRLNIKPVRDIKPYA